MLGVGAVADVDLLNEIFAVPELFVRKGASLFEHFSVIFRRCRITDGGRHALRRLQRGEVHTLEPCGRSEHLHIERVVLSALQHAVAVEIPFVRVLLAPCVVDEALDHAPVFLQPLVVFAELPFAVGFDDGSHLSVHAGAERTLSSAERQLGAEAHIAVFVGIVFKLCVANRALQLGKQEAERVSVAPDVRAGAFARACVLTNALPAVERAVLEAKYRRGFQNGERRGDRIDHRGIECGAVERIAEFFRLAIKLASVFQRVLRALQRIRKSRRVVRLPHDIVSVFVEIRRPIVIIVRNVPRQNEGEAFRFSGGHRLRAADCANVILPRLLIRARVQIAHRQLMPEGRDGVLPSTAVPIFLHDGIPHIRRDGQIAVAFFGNRFFRVFQRDRRHRAVARLLVFRSREGIADGENDGIAHVIHTALDIDIEESRRESGIIRFSGDQRVERRHRNVSRKILVRKSQGRDRKSSVERNVAEMRKSAHRSRVRSEAEAAEAILRKCSRELFFLIALQDLRHSFSVGKLRAYREKAIGIHTALVRTIEDLPIDKRSVSRNSERARTNAAERKRDLAEIFVFV